MQLIGSFSLNRGRRQSTHSVGHAEGVAGRRCQHLQHMGSKTPQLACRQSCYSSLPIQLYRAAWTGVHVTCGKCGAGVNTYANYLGTGTQWNNQSSFLYLTCQSHLCLRYSHFGPRKTLGKSSLHPSAVKSLMEAVISEYSILLMIHVGFVDSRKDIGRAMN